MQCCIAILSMLIALFIGFLLGAWLANEYKIWESIAEAFGDKQNKATPEMKSTTFIMAT